MVELNVVSGVKNNVIGTYNVATAAVKKKGRKYGFNIN